MTNRLKNMSKAEHDAVVAELEDLGKRVAQVGNVIGPAFGAAWCDKALKLHRKVFALKIAVEDEWYRKNGLSAFVSRSPTPPGA